MVRSIFNRGKNNKTIDNQNKIGYNKDNQGKEQ